jgi:hypothetical protein
MQALVIVVLSNYQRTSEIDNIVGINFFLVVKVSRAFIPVFRKQNTGQFKYHIDRRSCQFAAWQLLSFYKTCCGEFF